MSQDNAPFLKEIKETESALRLLEDSVYISDSTISFFRDITRAQYKIKEKLGKEITISLSEEEIDKKLQNSLPLISCSDLPLNPSHISYLFQEICLIINKQNDSVPEEIQRLLDAEKDGVFELRMLIEKLVTQDNNSFQYLSRKLKIIENILIYTVLQTAKPFFETAAEEFRDKVSEDQWIKNYCPVCGCGALIARLDKKNGKRMLYCILCSNEWRFLRLKCPFCCNENQKKLMFIEEEKGPYRIDICEQCKRYIKTFDERKESSGEKTFIPSIEDLATMYLDIIAEKEGYVRTWFLPREI